MRKRLRKKTQSGEFKPCSYEIVVTLAEPLDDAGVNELLRDLSRYLERPLRTWVKNLC
jgi:uncharacterized protein YggL (DUF469 family)